MIKNVGEEGGALKKIVVFMGVLLFVLAGCVKEVELVEEPEVIPKAVEKEIQQLVVDPEVYHFTVGWLSGDEVLFVEKGDGHYAIKTFHIFTKEIQTIYEDEKIIADVLIHPSKERLLVHTTASSTLATVKIISLAGIVEREVVVESSELAIEWHDEDPDRVLLTAFYEDWSFDNFLYEGQSNELSLLSIDEPFPKWLGRDDFVFLREDGALVRYARETGKQETLVASDVLYVETFKDSLLIAEETADEKVVYRLLNEAKNLSFVWETSFNREDFTLNRPQFDWLDESRFVSLRPSADALYELVTYGKEKETVLAADVMNTRLICSPAQDKCLTGYDLAEMMDLTRKKKMNWLQYDT